MKLAKVLRSVSVAVVFVLLIGFLLYYNSSKSEEQTAAEPKTALSPVEWLLGTWEKQSDSLVFQEVWEIQDAASFEGDGYLIKANDTVFHENLSILLLNGQVVYITQFKDQTPVMFHLVSSEGNYLVFENKEHIYPSKISYNLINDSTMIAGLEGKNEFGEFVRRDFKYSRAEQ